MRFSAASRFPISAVAAGEAVAITGASGCGKTTLMNLLLGMLIPTRGEVVIGGKNLRYQGSMRYAE